ncbi:hypothetical protein AX16_006206 [Volvariella volvacea WC 439]|nr:hypothetical protein AX16_006206 [Volvariella volvacea WC 439]
MHPYCHNRHHSDNVHVLKRHPDYYIQGGDLHVVVEDVQFRVHSHFFERESPRFQRLLNCPVPGSERSGRSESAALKLEDVPASDFVVLLKIFYNPKFNIYDTFKTDDWITLLRVSTQWQFPEVRSLAIRQLESAYMPIIDRVRIYQENRVDEQILYWRYRELCSRPEGLTLLEATQLGLETSIRIFQVRERALVCVHDDPELPDTHARNGAATPQPAADPSSSLSPSPRPPSSSRLVIDEPKLSAAMLLIFGIPEPGTGRPLTPLSRPCSPVPKGNSRPSRSKSKSGPTVNGIPKHRGNATASRGH